MQYKENFWSGLERAYADKDNAQFDAHHYRKQQRRSVRREKILVIGGLVTAVFVTFFVYGLVIFRII